MLLDDPIANAQPKSRTFAYWLGRGESTGVMAPDCSVFIRLRRDRFRCKYSCPSSALRVGVGLKLEGEGEYAAGQRLDSVRANLG